MYLIAKEDAWHPLFFVTLQPPYNTYQESECVCYPFFVFQLVLHMCIV